MKTPTDTADASEAKANLLRAKETLGQAIDTVIDLIEDHQFLMHRPDGSLAKDSQVSSVEEEEALTIDPQTRHNLVASFRSLVQDEESIASVSEFPEDLLSTPLDFLDPVPPHYIDPKSDGDLEGIQLPEPMKLSDALDLMEEVDHEDYSAQHYGRIKKYYESDGGFHSEFKPDDEELPGDLLL